MFLSSFFQLLKFSEFLSIFDSSYKHLRNVNSDFLSKQLNLFGVIGQKISITESTSENNFSTFVGSEPFACHWKTQLILIYINDIQELLWKASIFLFADDTNTLYADNNLKSLEDIVNQELRKLGDWLTANELTLNIKKANFVIFCPAQRKFTFQLNITIFHNDKNKYVSLERKECVKYLGIFIDQNLTWKHHIDYLAFKISRYVGLLSKLRHHVPTHTLIIIYRSLISQHLNLWLVSLEPSL